MNARQRRARRRARGMRPPYPCMWCGTVLLGLQDPCVCEVDPRPRKPVLDHKLEGLFVKAHDRGYAVDVRSELYTPLEMLARYEEPNPYALGTIHVTIRPREDIP